MRGTTAGRPGRAEPSKPNWRVQALPGGGVRSSGSIRNCLIALNRATSVSGGGIWSSSATIESCTIVSNSALTSGGGLYAGALTVTGTNNVIYHNTAASAPNFTNTAGNTGLNYSCVIPAVDGTGNITSDPAFKNLAGGNYRLTANSPCVNAGTNQAWMTTAVDLDGTPRLDRYTGLVDMGAYEFFVPRGMIISIMGASP